MPVTIEDIMDQLGVPSSDRKKLSKKDNRPAAMNKMLRDAAVSETRRRMLESVTDPAAEMLANVQEVSPEDKEAEILAGASGEAAGTAIQSAKNANRAGAKVMESNLVKDAVMRNLMSADTPPPVPGQESGTARVLGNLDKIIKKESTKLSALKNVQKFAKLASKLSGGASIALTIPKLIEDIQAGEISEEPLSLGGIVEAVAEPAVAGEGSDEIPADEMTMEELKHLATKGK